MLKRRTVRIVFLFLSVLSLSGPQLSFAKDGGCSTYENQTWAQAVFDADAARFGGLDPDGDNVACEDLQPGPVPSLWTGTEPVGAEPVTVTGVTDAQTVEVVLDGHRESIRLLGIDGEICNQQEATRFLEHLFAQEGTAFVEADISDRDHAGHLLRHMWFDRGRGQVYLVSEALVRSGYAMSATIPPDVRYHDQIRQASLFARAHGYGLWFTCRLDQTKPYTPLDDAATLDEESRAACATSPLYASGTVVTARNLGYLALRDDFKLVLPGTQLRITGPVIEEGICDDWPVEVIQVPLAALGATGSDICCTSAVGDEGKITELMLNGQAAPANVVGNCDASYPDICIPHPPPDLDCADIAEGNFRVVGADPHRLDGPYDGSNPNEPDGIGCEWN